MIELGRESATMVLESSGNVPRPAPTAPWAPTASRSMRRPDELPLLSPELTQRFRRLCALRDADPARVLEGLVRSYVILQLAGGAR